MTTTASSTTANDTGRATTTARRSLTGHPETAWDTGSAATAVITGGLRDQVDGPGGVDPALLRDLVARADQHPPVTDAVRRAVPVTVEVEVTDGVPS